MKMSFSNNRLKNEVKNQDHENSKIAKIVSRERFEGCGGTNKSTPIKGGNMIILSPKEVI